MRKCVTASPLLGLPSRVSRAVPSPPATGPGIHGATARPMAVPYVYKNPLTVNGGDIVKITYGYDMTNRDTVTKSGKGTEDEMCIAFFHVTFAIDVNVCPKCGGRMKWRQVA